MTGLESSSFTGSFIHFIWGRDEYHLSPLLRSHHPTCTQGSRVLGAITGEFWGCWQSPWGGLGWEAGRAGPGRLPRRPGGIIQGFLIIQDGLYRSGPSRAPSGVCHTPPPSAGYSKVPFFVVVEWVCVCVCMLELQNFIISHSRHSRWRQGRAPLKPVGSPFASPYLLRGAGDPRWPWPPTALLHLCFVSICVLPGCLSSHGHHLIWTPGLLD